MEFDRTRTAAVFVALIVIANGALIAAPIPMRTGTILMMVLPSTVIFGLISLAIGVKYGEYRARAA